MDLAKSIAASSKQVTLAGLYCHEGQSYYAHNAGEIRAVGDESAERILNLANRSGSLPSHYTISVDDNSFFLIFSFSFFSFFACFSFFIIIFFFFYLSRLL